MRPTRPSWKPSGPSHRRSPSHRASDFLKHPNRLLIAFRRFFYGLGTFITSYCIHTSLCCRDTLSLSPTLFSHAFGRGEGDVRLIPYLSSEILRSGHSTTGGRLAGSLEGFRHAIIAHFKGMHHLPVSLPSHPLSRYLDRRTINNAHTKPNFPIVFRSRDLEM
jgi:hypothetical protein